MPILVDSTSTPEGFRGFAGDTPGKVLDQDLVVNLGDVTLGIVDDSGVRVYVTGINGWWNGTGSTGQVTQRVGDHGGWSNLAYRTPRHIELDIELQGLDFDHVTPVLEAVIAAIPLRSDVLQVSKGTEALQATVQQDGEPLVDRNGPNAKITVDLSAPDPRRYSVDTVSNYAGLPQTDGGLSLPISLPLSIDATLTTGQFVATNDGNIDTPPTFTVQGPCPPFSITNQTIGATLRFADSIASGRKLTIDTARRLALLDGTATRTVTGTWFTYTPGDNRIGFSASSFDPGALLTSTHRNAWK